MILLSEREQKIMRLKNEMYKKQIVDLKIKNEWLTEEVLKLNLAFVSVPTGTFCPVCGGKDGEHGYDTTGTLCPRAKGQTAR